MAFKIALSPTYKRKVTVELPNDKGTMDKATFMAEFKRCDQDEIERLGQIPHQRAVLEEVLVGFTDLQDENNQPVPYSEATKDALLKIPQALQGTAREFWLSVYRAPEKN